MSIAYAGSRISAQLLCRNVTPIAKRPTAVTTLLFSLSVKARSVDCAKLGSARVRPLPETCLGGILDVLEAGVLLDLVEGLRCRELAGKLMRYR